MTLKRVFIQDGNLGVAIKAYRKLNNLTQDDFGKMINFAGSRICELEKIGSRIASSNNLWDEYFAKKPNFKSRKIIFDKVRELISLDPKSIPKTGSWRVKKFTFLDELIRFINKEKLLPGQFQILPTGHSLYDLVYWEEKKRPRRWFDVLTECAT